MPAAIGMNPDPTEDKILSLRGALLGCIGAVILGLLAMTGWMTGWMKLASLRSDYIPMPPSTAVIIIGYGYLLLQSILKEDPKLTHFQRLLLGALILPCLLTLTDSLFHTGLHADLLFVKNPVPFLNVTSGKMSPITALSFLLMLSAYLPIPFRFWNLLKKFSGWFVLCSLLIHFTVLMGYLYGTPILYGNKIVPVAATTSIACLCLGISTALRLGAHHAPLNLLFGNSVQAKIFRVLIPAVLFADLACDYSAVLLHEALPSNPALISVLGAIVSTLVIAFVVLNRTVTIANRLEKIESDRKRVEDQLRKSQRMENIGALSGGIAHDLNNILAPILMASQLLAKKLPEDEKLVSMIETSAKRGSEMVKQILMFSRGLEGQQVLIQPTHLIRDIASLIRQTFPKSIEVDAEIPPDLQLLIADAAQLHQVLLNICVYARDSMPKGGKIYLRAENLDLDEASIPLQGSAKPGPYVLIYISDTGAGVPKEIGEKVLNPTLTTKSSDKGGEMGLSIAAKIVSEHRGFITVYNDPGKGSSFRIYLPARQGGRSTRPSDPPNELLRGSGESILLIDDEASICGIAQTALESFGYQVTAASNGREALQLASRNGSQFQLVICDEDMPMMDGVTTILELKKRDPRLKFIMTSGFDSRRNLGIDRPYISAYLSKPYTTEQLLHAIHQIFHDQG